MRRLLIACTFIERLGGWIWLPFNLLMPVFGLFDLLRNWRVHPLALPIIILGVLAAISGLPINPNPTETWIRAAQLVGMGAFFSWLLIRTNHHLIAQAAVMMIPIMALAFCAELLLKPELRQAIIELNISYFWTSGGASFENSGVMLLSGGNVYAAAGAGALGLIAWQAGHKKWAALALMLACLTGSRALFLTFSVLVIYWLLISGRPYLRRLVLLMALSIIGAQPFLFTLHEALPISIQTSLQNLSPRYVAWTAYAQMGFDHPLGVGYFQGKSFGNYFWDRWPIQAHNITIGIWGELGPPAYLCWMWFLYRLGAYAARSDQACVLFLFTLIMYSFIGGLNEWSLWVPFALVFHMSKGYAHAKKGQKALPRARATKTGGYPVLP